MSNVNHEVLCGDAGQGSVLFPVVALLPVACWSDHCQQVWLWHWSLTEKNIEEYHRGMNNSHCTTQRKTKQVIADAHRKHTYEYLFESIWFISITKLESVCIHSWMQTKNSGFFLQAGSCPYTYIPIHAIYNRKFDNSLITTPAHLAYLSVHL